LKFLSTIITGAIVGALVVYFTLDWQEEKLIYSITTPAKFGEINYQNITITNTGWNPATNINIHIEHPDINFKNTQSKTTLKNLSKEKNGIASIERIRRDESVIISLAYTGQPLFGAQITVSSDRSIAEHVDNESGDDFPGWAMSLLAYMGIAWIIGALAATAIPAYNSYIKAAKLAKEKEN
jgi:hypothetical protein